MPRLRGSIFPEKWRKKGSFSKSRKQNKSPSVDVAHEGQNHNASDPLVEIRTAVSCANILVTLYMVGATVPSRWIIPYAGIVGKQTYFTPAPWSFLMWPLIHSLMLGGCIYQFSSRGSYVFIDQVGWTLSLLQISNATYIRCRNSLRYKYAFVFIIITYLMVNKIYRKTNKISPRHIRDQLFCHLPISLYHGWVLGLMFLAAFEAFGVDATITPPRSGTKISVLVSLLLIQSFERAYASPATEGDIFACMTVSWFLFAITVEQSSVRSAFVHWSVHGFTIFSLCWITKCMIGLELRDNKKVFEKEDRGPLLYS
ncbi:hypothetical protein V8E55_010068 [Tylopilus felleus]